MDKSKYILTILAVFLSLAVGQVRANEGGIVLREGGESRAVCLGTSVFVDSRYRVLLSCRGLEMAADPVFNRYVVWAKEEDDKFRRLGEIENGKLQGSNDEAFGVIEISLESKRSPLRPSGRVVMTGKVEAFDFGSKTGEVREVVLDNEINQTNEKEVDNGNEKEVDNGNEKEVDDRGVITPETEGTTSGLSKVLSIVLKVLLASFVVVILVVGMFSYFSGKRR